MAYRSADPSELELRERRTRIRREHDELEERADELARKLAEQNGGVLGAIKNLISGMTDDEVTRARADHAALEAQIATLVESERDVDAQLARIDASRAELDAQEATRIEAARSAPGPLGDQLRAIGAERALARTRLADFDAALREALRAATVVEEIGNIDGAPTSPVVKSIHNTAAVLTAGDVHTGDREASTSRRASHVELACTTIQSLVASFTRLAHAWPDPKPIELATRQLTSMTPKSFDVASARTCIERLDHAIVSERDAHARTFAQLDDRERALVRGA